MSLSYEKKTTMKIRAGTRLRNSSIVTVLFLTWISSQTKLTTASQCEPIQIEMCRSMQWNMTSMPNLLSHSTQQNAILSIEPWKELVDTGCSDVLLFFLCAMYAPICTPHFIEPVPPCKSVCRKAKSRCEPIMNQYNVSWPRNLECSALPEYNKGVCLSPDAIVASIPREGNSRSAVISTSKLLSSPLRCDCKKRNKLGKKLYMRKHFDYAMKGTFKSAEGIKGGPLIITIHVEEILKSTHVRIPTSTDLTLWAGGGCICPQLITKKRYLFLGYEDAENKRLLFDENSMALEWKDRWHRNIDRWESHMTKDNRRRRHRRKKRKHAQQNQDVQSSNSKQSQKKKSKKQPKDSLFQEGRRDISSQKRRRLLMKSSSSNFDLLRFTD